MKLFLILILVCYTQHFAVSVHKSNANLSIKLAGTGNHGRIQVKYFRRQKELEEYSTTHFPVNTNVITVPIDKSAIDKSGAGHLEVTQIKISYQQKNLFKGLFGSGPGQFRNGVAISSDRFNQLYITDVASDKIIQYSRNLQFQKSIGSFNWDTAQSFENDFSSIEENQFNRPLDFTAGENLNFFVSDSQNNRVVQLDVSHNFVSEIKPPDGFDEPSSMAISSKKELIVLDSENERLVFFSLFGKMLFTIGGFGKTSDRFQALSDFVLDSNNKIFALDPSAAVIKKFSHNSAFITQKAVKAGAQRLALEPHGYILVLGKNGIDVLTPNLQNGPDLFPHSLKTKIIDACFTTDQHLFMLHADHSLISEWLPRYEVTKTKISL